MKLALLVKNKSAWFITGLFLLCLRDDFQEFPNGKWLVAVSAVIEIDVAESVLIVEFVEKKRLLFWYMADQNVTTEGDAHPVAGEVVGSDLLFGLQLDFRDEMTAV